MSYDYLFVSKRGELLAKATLADEGAAETKAVELAREYNGPVTYVAVCDYNVEPARCPRCNQYTPCGCEATR